MTIHLRRLAATSIAVIALLGVATAGAAQAGAPPAHAAAHHKKHHKRHHSTIPQHNGGDRDSDNRGGPSDGDGSI